MKPQPPCKNCSERAAGCHAECDLYLTFRRNLDRYNQLIKEQTYGDAKTFLIEQTIKRRS